MQLSETKPLFQCQPAPSPVFVALYDFESMSVSVLLDSSNLICQRQLLQIGGHPKILGSGNLRKGGHSDSLPCDLLESYALAANSTV